MQQKLIPFVLPLLLGAVAVSVRAVEPSVDLPAMQPGPDGVLSSWSTIGPFPDNALKKGRCGDSKAFEV